MYIKHPVLDEWQRSLTLTSCYKLFTPCRVNVRGGGMCLLLTLPSLLHSLCWGSHSASTQTTGCPHIIFSYKINWVIKTINQIYRVSQKHSLSKCKFWLFLMLMISLTFVYSDFKVGNFLCIMKYEQQFLRYCKMLVCKDYQQQSITRHCSDKSKPWRLLYSTPTYHMLQRVNFTGMCSLTWATAVIPWILVIPWEDILL